MKPAILNLLRCPRCGGVLGLSGAETNALEVVSGSLICASCDHSFEIIDGLPILLPGTGARNRTQRSFGLQWTWQRSGQFEAETIYGNTADYELRDFQKAFGLSNDLQELVGKRVLDAGCGSGRLTVNLAKAVPTATVVGFDFSDSALVAYERSSGIPNVHIVKTDLLQPPFAPESFDYIWSEGVLHALPSAKAGFDSLLIGDN